MSKIQITIKGESVKSIIQAMVVVGRRLVDGDEKGDGTTTRSSYYFETLERNEEDGK